MSMEDPTMIATVREILERSGTRFEPGTAFPVYDGVGDPKRGAYLDYRFGSFQVMVHGRGPGDELGSRSLRKLGQEITEVVEIMARLREAGAPVRR